jgi:hypothetical protein
MTTGLALASRQRWKRVRKGEEYCFSLEGECSGFLRLTQMPVVVKAGKDSKIQALARRAKCYLCFTWELYFRSGNANVANRKTLPFQLD